jgi:hypothetical protein
MPDISDNQLADRLQLVGSWLLKQRGEGALHPGTIMDAPLLAEVFRGAIFWDEGANGIADALYVVRKNDADELEFAQVVVDAEVGGMLEAFVEHTEATVAHGATGAVVGTTNTQTLTNKTLTEPVLDTPTVTDFTNMPHAHISPETGGYVGHVQPVFNVKDYGAVGDGVADDTTAFTEARTAAGSTGTVYIPEGRYRLTQTVFSGSAPVHVKGAGPENTVLIQDGDFTVISISGTQGAIKILAADAAAGATTITFTSGTNVAAGDWMVITHAVAFPGPKNSYEGEVIRVKEMSGATATLYWPLEGGYTTANSASARVHYPVDGVSIKGFSIVNEQTTDKSSDFITLTYSHRARVQDVHFTGLVQNCIGINYATEWWVDRCHFTDTHGVNGGHTHLGYGVTAGYAHRGGIMSRCVGHTLAHNFTTGSTATRAVPKHILVTDCYSNGSANAFDTHQEGQFITFKDCISIGTEATSGACFQVRAPDVTFDGCRGYGGAFGLESAIDLASPGRLTIRNCEFYNQTNEGLRLSGHDTSVHDTRVFGSTNYGIRWFSGDRGRVVDCEVDGTGNAAVYIPSGSDHFIDRLHVRNCGRTVRIDSGATVALGRIFEMGTITNTPLFSSVPTLTLNYVNSVASAATISLPGFEHAGFIITGTTTITSITAQAGRLVTLKFSGICSVTDGSNLKLRGNFTSAADDTLTLWCDGTNWYEISRSTDTTHTQSASLIYTLDGAGAPISTGAKGFIGPLGYTATITGWTLTSDVSATVTMDIWKDTLANHPPTNGDSITASAKPGLSAAVQASSTTLTGWTTSIGATDILRFEVEANNNATYLTLQLAITRAV